MYRKMHQIAYYNMRFGAFCGTFWQQALIQQFTKAYKKISGLLYLLSCVYMSVCLSVLFE